MNTIKVKVNLSSITRTAIANIWKMLSHKASFCRAQSMAKLLMILKENQWELQEGK